MSDQPAQKIGKYEILEEIGRGGFAVVYKARDPNLDRTIALKVLAPHLAWQPSYVKRFRHEAKATAKLRHPHIVVVYEVGEAEGQPYIAMTYLPGRTLAKLLKAEGAMSLERALPILEQVADALDYAHRRGVIHRDVKPSNVMLEETEHGLQATLMDFGLVKALESSESLTSAGTILGSPEYMAPEQADLDRKSEIGPATDRYALGVVAYEMLTGRVPFPGNTPATLYAHLNLAPPDPRSIYENLPESAARVLLKALSKPQQGRYPTAKGMVEALREAQAEEEVQAVERRAEKERERRRAQARAEEEARAAEKVREALKRRRPPVARPPRKLFPVWGWVVASGLILTLLIGGGWLVASMVTPTPTATLTPSPSSPTLDETSTPTSPPSETPTSTTVTQVREKDGAVMVYVPAGTFWMGSDDSDPDAYSNEKPQHEVYLDAFWIDRTEVTNGQYRRCVADGACNPPSKSGSSARESYYGNAEFDDYPVVYVDWSQAEAYCAWAGARLPTEAEWEKAARGDDRRIYPWGDAFDGSRLNFCDRDCQFDWKDEKVDDGYADTAPVGSYPVGASPYGALDMAGNVWEWVADWYADDYYTHSPGNNPQGPGSGTLRVVRGGSWRDPQRYVRAAYRSENGPSYASSYRGFRCARSAPGS
jgi:formylglycine-generating enzyme required for sulfatase activity/tRNA A-37 threonylcarbamoyl transferase component Bud32